MWCGAVRCGAVCHFTAPQTALKKGVSELLCRRRRHASSAVASDRFDVRQAAQATADNAAEAQLQYLRPSILHRVLLVFNELLKLVICSGREVYSGGNDGIFLAHDIETNIVLDRIDFDGSGDKNGYAVYNISANVGFHSINETNILDKIQNAH